VARVHARPVEPARDQCRRDRCAEHAASGCGLKTDALGTPGEIDIGDYSDLDRHTLRSEALDCPVGALDAACPGGAATSVGGYTYGDFGKVFGTPEVHGDGEIWAQTLWDLRQALVVKLGSDTQASDIAEILISDGMRFSPPEPSMLDMRNAILTADQADFGGAAHDLVWDVFRKRGMGYFAAAADGSDITPAEDFSSPPPPNGPTGTVTGVVTDADTGLPRAGLSVGLGGHTTPNAEEFLADTTDAEGRYTITDVPVGTYPKLAVSPDVGFDPFVARNIVVNTNATTTQDATVRRDWASLSGGATVESVSDDTGANFGCGVDEAFDQSQGTTWSAFNPTSPDPDNPGAGPPTVVLALPATIDVTAFLLDPSAGCGDGASATTREYRLETSADGATFSVAVDGTGANAFTDDDIGRLTRVVPAGTTGANVRYIRLTLLSPLRQGDDCLPSTCSGTDFIDFSELEILGGAPNVLPSGTLSVDHASVTTGTPVTFDAAFTDPDSKITGYDWDFDGNGTVDRTTTEPTTAFAFAALGTFVSRVSARDFRGGAGTATREVTRGGAAAPAGRTGRTAGPRRSAGRTGPAATATAGRGSARVERRRAAAEHRPAVPRDEGRHRARELPRHLHRHRPADRRQRARAPARPAGGLADDRLADPHAQPERAPPHHDPHPGRPPRGGAFSAPAPDQRDGRRHRHAHRREQTQRAARRLDHAVGVTAAARAPAARRGTPAAARRAPAHSAPRAGRPASRRAGGRSSAPRRGRSAGRRRWRA
jgi:hypothetical protein